jgi:hypothetical protein
VTCAPHRPYLAAIADGELDLVPASTLAHVRNCQACGREIGDHSLLTDRLRLAVAPARGRRAPALRRPVVAAVAALLVAVTAAGLAAWHGPGGQDQVAVAADAAHGPLQFRSGDDAAIGAWCERQSGRPMPVVAVPSLTPLGARSDRLAGADVVTVAYRTETGARVTVSWLDAARDPPGVQERAAAGREVLVVRSPSGTAVVTGDAPTPVLRAVAASLV